MSSLARVSGLPALARGTFLGMKACDNPIAPNTNRSCRLTQPAWVVANVTKSYTSLLSPKCNCDLRRDLHSNLSSNHSRYLALCHKSLAPFNFNTSLLKKRSSYNNSWKEGRKAIHKHNEAGHKQARREFFLSPQGIVEASPENIQPYMKLMRIDRPIGNWLLFLPCAWSISLSSVPGVLPDPQMLALFGLGSFFMRGVGCTINDMMDKDLDRMVERTKNRPLACGDISSFQALVFLGLQLSASLAILLTFNWNTVLLGACSLVPCVIYPLMKRVTYWPQAFLGITLNWGVLISWSAIHGQLEIPGVILYISCMFWSMIYDTIYSHQDKMDDIQAGVKSTALKFGDDSKKWLTLFSSVMVGGLATTGVMCEQTWPYFAGVAVVAAHLGHQIYTVDLNKAEECGNKFRSNKYLGIGFWLMIIAANLIKKENTPDTSKEQGDFKSI